MTVDGWMLLGRGLAFKTTFENLVDGYVHRWKPVFGSEHLFGFGFSTVSLLVCDCNNLLLQAVGKNNLVHSAENTAGFIPFILDGTERWASFLYFIQFPSRMVRLSCWRVLSFAVATLILLKTMAGSAL